MSIDLWINPKLPTAQASSRTFKSNTPLNGAKKETGNSNGVSNRQKIHQSTSFKTNPSTNLILVWYSFPWRFQMKLLFCYYQSLFSSRPLEELVQNWELLKCLQKYLFSLVQQQGTNNVSCKHNTSIFYKWRGIIALLNV